MNGLYVCALICEFVSIWYQLCLTGSKPVRDIWLSKGLTTKLSGIFGRTSWRSASLLSDSYWLRTFNFDVLRSSNDVPPFKWRCLYMELTAWMCIGSLFQNRTIAKTAMLCSPEVSRSNQTVFNRFEYITVAWQQFTYKSIAYPISVKWHRYLYPMLAIVIIRAYMTGHFAIQTDVELCHQPFYLPQKPFGNC